MGAVQVQYMDQGNGMALKNCHECGNPISTSATNCPKCGAPPKKWTPARKLFIGMAVIIVLIVIGSMNDDLPMPGSNAPSPAGQSRAERTAQLKRMKDEARAAFDAHGKETIAAAKASIDAGDLAAAQTAISSWTSVKDPELDALRRELAVKKKERDAALEKADLLKRASTLEAKDGAEGEGIYMRLVEIEPGNELFKKKLSDFSKVHQKQAEEAMQMAALSRRQRYARLLEDQMLSKGMSADVVTQGKQSTTLHIKYVLVSKAFVYQFNHNADLMAEIRSSGFTKVVLTDGFNETWTLDLTKKAQ